MFRIFLISIVLTIVTSASYSQTSTITGVILDSASKEPLVGTNVFLPGTGTGTSSNGEGRFNILDVEPGTHLIRFSYVGYASYDTTIELSPGDSLFLRVALYPREIESDLIVVSATRTLRSIGDVPVRIEAIPEEEIEEKLLMTPSSVAMLLNESTGMRVQTTSAAASTANLRIQGLSGRYTQILYDGIPSLGGLSAGLSLTQLIPLDLRQVEILKGATSSLYGSDAIAGVVNFLPKIPGSVSETSLLINGTTQKGFDLAGYYSDQIGKTGLSIMASHNRQPRFDTDNDGFADVAEFLRTSITPRFRHEFSDDVSARVGIAFMDEDRIGGAMGEASSGSPSYREQIHTRRVEASSHVDWQLSANQSLSVKLAFLHSNRDATFGSTPFNASQWVQFGDVQYTVELPENSILVGSAFRVEDFQDRTVGQAGRSYRFAVPSLFVQDEMRWSDALTVVAGGRLDFHNLYGTLFVPRFSVMVRPTRSLAFRLGGGMGYKAPTIFVEEAEEIGFRNVRSLGDVQPEKAISGSVDLNWRQIVAPITLEINSALFVTKVQSSILADEDSLAGGVVFLRNATGSTTSIGGEISLRMTYDDAKLSLGYTYVSAHQVDMGRSSEMELNPKHSFGAILIWEDHTEQFMMGLEQYWTSSQRVPRNPFRTASPSYWITGFIVQKGFGNLRVFVNFENIFDTRQTRFDPVFVGSLTGSGFRALPVYAPLEGRVINAGIRLVLKPSE